jgi:arginase
MKILVPYHLDTYLPDLDVPFEADVTLTTPLPDGDPWERMAHLYEWVGSAVADAVRGGELPVVASGDCTTAVGIVTGLQRSGVDPAIVWFDAHGDVQTVETSASGYLGGMPLRMLTGYGRPLLADRLGTHDIAEDRIVLVDGRDLDPPEVEYLRRSRILRRSVAELAAGALPDGALPDGPIYLHLDCDVVDPDDLPGLMYPAPGGPRLGPVGEALRAVIATGRVAAVGIACTWRPGHGSGDRMRPVISGLLG